jgi:hypothetical protein
MNEGRKYGLCAQHAAHIFGILSRTAYVLYKMVRSVCKDITGINKLST